MRRPNPGSMSFVAAGVIVFSTILFFGCQQSRERTETAAAPTAASTEKVFVTFEGPWAVAPDPKDDSKVLVIAPKTASHKDLYVTASNSATLAAGVYELSVPVAGKAGAPATIGDYAQAKTTAADLQSVLDSKSVRYVIRLPKPEAYVASAHFHSRVDTSYPPRESTEKDYVSAVSLRYSASSLNGFSLSGSADTGSFKPFLFNVETPHLMFVIDPVHDFDPNETCHVHARESFRDLTHLLKVTLYIDFPKDKPSCHDTDPQKSKMSEIYPPLKSDALAALLRGDVVPVQEASMIPKIAPGYFLFATRPPVCTGAIILLGTS